MSEADPLGLFFALLPVLREVYGMTKVAVLIDGGYFLKRLSVVRRDVDMDDAESVVRAIEQLVRGHLDQLNEVHGQQQEMHKDNRGNRDGKDNRDKSVFRLLYRSFYYDARPYNEKVQLPISKKPFDYAKSTQARFRNKLFDLLRRRPSFAVRLGDVRKGGGAFWTLKADKYERFLKGKEGLGGLDDADFNPSLRQKGVDMRIGLDIASITLKRQANIIVLVSGDSDFVPAAKLARREGVQFILDPLWQNVSPDLFEHIDLLQSGFYRPKQAVRR